MLNSHRHHCRFERSTGTQKMSGYRFSGAAHRLMLLCTEDQLYCLTFRRVIGGRGSTMQVYITYLINADFSVLK